MDNLLTKAITIAVEAHGDQTDKSGQPFIGHPLRVMAKLAHRGIFYSTIAILHDTVEDTDVTPEFLLEQGMTPDVIEIVKILTHDPDDTYGEYITKIKANLHATICKLADLEDNMDPRRIYSESAKERVNGRYTKAVKVLTGELEKW